MAHILLAEDEGDIAMLIQFKLEQEGHRVTVTRDGKAALEAFEREPAEVAILDVMMPRLDGFQVARSLSHMPDPPRVLMLTARGREEDIESGFAAGAHDYLVKPFSPRELVSRVNALLRR